VSKSTTDVVLLILYQKQINPPTNAYYKINQAISDSSTVHTRWLYITGSFGRVLKYTYAAIIAEMASNVGRTIVNKRSLCFEKSSRRSRFSLCDSFTLPFSCFIMRQAIQTESRDNVCWPHRKQDIQWCKSEHAKDNYSAWLCHEQVNVLQYTTRSPAIAEGPRDAGVPVEIW